MKKLKNCKVEIIALFIVIILLIGSSYALFVISNQSTNEIKFTGHQYQSLVLNDTEATSINMLNAYPMSDSKGLRTTVYEFTLTNNDTIYQDYTLYIDTYKDLPNETLGEYKKISFTKNGTTNPVVELSSLPTMPLTEDDPTMDDTIMKKIIIDEGLIAPGETITYSYQIWIKEDAPDTVQGTMFNGKVKVLGSQTIERYSAMKAVDAPGGWFEALGTIYQTSVAYDEINEIIFEKSSDTTSYENAINKWDFSNNNDESILAYLDNNKVFHIQSENKILAPESLNNMFAIPITKVNFENFSTINTINMTNMFNYSELTSIDLSSFDTSNVVDMSEMFYESKFTSLDLSNFDTSKVIKMNNMFKDTEVQSLNLSSFDTSNVVDMSGMFQLSKVNTLNLDNFNTSKVTNMSSMFATETIQNLNINSFDTSNVVNMSSMFGEIGEISLNLSSFDTSKVTDMGWMFSNSEISSLDLSNFDTRQVTDMEYMFYNSVVTSLDLNSFDTSKVTNMSNMFFESAVTTVYARTLADKTKYDTSSGKPTGLNVIVGTP